MSIPIEAVQVIVRLWGHGKEEAFEYLNEAVPEVTDEELEQMWQKRPKTLVIH
jgi:hypothetical protein